VAKNGFSCLESKQRCTLNAETASCNYLLYILQVSCPTRPQEGQLMGHLAVIINFPREETFPGAVWHAEHYSGVKNGNRSKGNENTGEQTERTECELYPVTGERGLLLRRSRHHSGHRQHCCGTSIPPLTPQTPVRITLCPKPITHTTRSTSTCGVLTGLKSTAASLRQPKTLRQSGVTHARISTVLA
jgi:hypothetical protein